jgi:hypothetical protein
LVITDSSPIAVVVVLNTTSVVVIGIWLKDKSEISNLDDAGVVAGGAVGAVHGH